MCFQLTGRTAGREPSYSTETMQRHFCKIKCCAPCSYCPRAFAKERIKSRGSRLSFLSNRLYSKICERCFLCHSIVVFPTCNKCKKCCHNSTCRGSTLKLLASLAGAGSRSEGCSNFERGLPPPLSDSTQTHKVSHSRKLLCQSPQGQLPDGGITSAYRQKCSGTSSKSKVTRVFQLALSSSETKQPVETYFRPEQAKSLPQGGEIQNGDTGNHQVLTPTRGMGHIHRLPGRLFPYTNTGTVQEIFEISCPRSDIPVQGSAVRSIHSTLGVYCGRKRSETDGHTQLYKNPPVPRRLVSESQIPPSLSPAYPSPSTNVPRPWLGGKFREIRTDPKTSFQLCGVPVRPPVRPGPTHTGPVAGPTGKDTVAAATTGMSGPAVHVPDRLTDYHRKASTPRSVTYGTHPVASQKQLAGTRIAGEGHSNTQDPSPSPTMVAGGEQCAPRSTIIPNTTYSANIYRRIKRRVGRSLRRTHCKRVLVPSRKQTAYKLSGTESSLSGFKRVPGSLYQQNSSDSDRQHYSSVLHKQGRGYEVGPAVCPSVENFDLVHQETCDHQSMTHSRPVKHGSGQTVQARPNYSNRMVAPPRVFQTICSRWHRPQVDLFATRFNNKLPLFVSPVPDSLATAVDALSLPWEDLDVYAFPPVAILGKVVEKLWDSPCKRMILIAPGWPNMPWFWDLVTMSSQIPLSLPSLPNLLTQPFNQIPHRNLTNLNLHAWLLEPQQSKNKDSLKQWQQGLRLLKEDQPDQSMRQSGPFLQSGASLIRWTSGHPL